MHGHRRAALAAGTLLTTLLLTLAGCGGEHPASGGAASPVTSSTPTPPSAPPSTPPSAASSMPSSPTPDPPVSSVSPTSSVAGCRTGDLHGSLKGGDGAAGTIYYRLTLTNAGDRPCALGGYGGVSFVGDGGRQLGAPARRDASQGGPRLLVLPAGGSAVARLGVAEAGNYDSSQCQPATARGLRVYPPNETASLFVAHRFVACTSSDVQLLTIQPYRAAD